jgi:hypothetical protein
MAFFVLQQHKVIFKSKSNNKGGKVNCPQTSMFAGSLRKTENTTKKAPDEIITVTN